MKTYDNFISNTVKESSLSRIYQHTIGRELGIITAFRNRHTKSKNLSRNRTLAGVLRDAGYGYIKLEGHWAEGYGTSKVVDTHEESLLVIGEEYNSGLKGLLKELGVRFNQDAVLFKPFDSEVAVLIGTSDEDEDGNEILFPGLGKEITAGKWHPNKVGEFYSKMRSGKTFVFETIISEQSIMGAWAKNLMTNDTEIVEKVKLDKIVGYTFYQKTFQDAIQHALDTIQNTIFTINKEEWDDVFSSQKEPESSGQVNKYNIKLYRDGELVNNRVYKVEIARVRYSFELTLSILIIS